MTAADWIGIAAVVTSTGAAVAAVIAALQGSKTHAAVQQVQADMQDKTPPEASP